MFVYKIATIHDYRWVELSKHQTYDEDIDEDNIQPQ